MLEAMAHARFSPRIGVALSGGGAAGMAHVGVLAELTAAGIRIDCVAGTSAGAMVGAAFAAEHLAAFHDTMCALTRRRVLWLFNPVWPHSGLFEAHRALDLIRPYVGERIETLPHAYAAVAADLRSGAEVVLRHGSVLEAIRASAAIPGLFTPQPSAGRLLVDGGLVNPLPVDVARQLGAPFVIAVSVLALPPNALLSPDEPGGLAAQLAARLHRHTKRPTAAPARPDIPAQRREAATVRDLSLVDVLTRASAMVQARIALSRLRRCPPDFLINVAVPEIGLFDFHRSAEAVAAGRAAARAAFPDLRLALAGPPLRRRVVRWLNGTTARPAPPRRPAQQSVSSAALHGH